MQEGGRKEKQERLHHKKVHAIELEVIDGKWWNGSERRRRLETAGYNYNEVQNEVNRILGCPKRH